ncbi:DUF1360 domain-containing protein [Nocardioides pantholopis]|uniref:DUF1360 domain-containing protein n=1 Tax=Nocardioides pantholopis TaxID=2483798 RepID=UPI000F07635F|nr:DUF1360 domain-containing protein [Nocardioides pantholopis]
MSDSPRDPHRIAGYLGSLGTFTTGIAATVLVARRRGKTWPERYAVTDLVLGAVATHKFARVLTKEGVTTPLRAPFTEFVGEGGSAEVTEKPKHGAAHVPGELLTCPFCMAPWIAATYTAGLALAPGPARAWAAVFGMVAGSDFLQHVYARTRED